MILKRLKNVTAIILAMSILLSLAAPALALREVTADDYKAIELVPGFWEDFIRVGNHVNLYNYNKLTNFTAINIVTTIVEIVTYSNSVKPDVPENIIKHYIRLICWNQSIKTVLNIIDALTFNENNAIILMYLCAVLILRC